MAGTRDADDPELILREMRIDWECVCGEDFNPLHLALRLRRDAVLAANFRDTFCRIERAMERVIADNFVGYSASITHYNAFAEHNQAALTALEHIQAASDTRARPEAPAARARIERIAEALPHLRAELESKEQEEAKHGLCQDLLRARQLMEEFELAEGTVQRCTVITRCLDILDRPAILKIKGAAEYRAQVYTRYQALVSEVCAAIAGYAIGGDMAGVRAFRGLETLGCLHELNEYLKKNFEAQLHEAIEGCLVDVQHTHSATALPELCQRVLGLVEGVLARMRDVARRVCATFETRGGRDFFGNEVEVYQFCTREEPVAAAAAAELDRFITRYSQATEDASGSFNLYAIVDDLDYTRLYGEHAPICARLAENANCTGTVDGVTPSTADFSLITAPRADVAALLLRCARHTALRNHLHTKIDNEYTRQRLDGQIACLNELFTGNPLTSAAADSPWALDTTHTHLRLWDAAMAIFDAHDPPEHRAALKEHLCERLCGTFARLATEMFPSPLINDTAVTEESPRPLPSDRTTQSTETAHSTRSSPAAPPHSATAASHEQFVKRLAEKAISKRDLTLTPSRCTFAAAALRTLEKFDGFILSDASARCYGSFRQAFSWQLFLEFFYFFDLFCREGSHRLYTKKMLRVPRAMVPHASLSLYDGLYNAVSFYLRLNMAVLAVKARKDLVSFVEHLRILDEMLAGTDRTASLKEMYAAFERVLNGSPKGNAEKMLLRKIEESGT